MPTNPINFPNTPANNETHTENGVSWKYDSTVGAWLTVQPATGGGGASVSVGNTAPVTPTNGDLWWNSDIGTLFVYYNDGSSSQWVENIPGSGFANSIETIAVSAFNKANTSPAFAAPKLDPAYYYFPTFTDNNGVSTAATAGRMWVFPYFFQRPTTFNRIGFRTHGTHTASVNVRLGLFNDRTSQTSNGPGTLIYDSGDMATVGADTDHVATINQTLVGTVWIAFMASGATASFQVAGYFRREFNLLFGVSDNQGYGLSGTAPFRDRTYGAYGDESGNTFSQSNLGSPVPF